MSNESSDQSDREIATSTFEDWLTQKAAETDSSRERVLEQLLDSYWTLKEVTQVLDGRNRTPMFADDGGGERPGANRHGQAAMTDGAVTEDEFDELVQRVESLQTELQTESRQRSTLAEEVQSIADRLDDVEAGYEDVDELTDTVDDVRSTLETEQSQLQARLDEEFENLRTILEYLVQTGDELDVRLTETQAQYQAEIRELRAERDQLRRLREAAREAGTHTADCEQCGGTVDFTLLTSPECPNCNRTLTGVAEETTWFFLSTYTATTGRSPGASPTETTGQSKTADEPASTAEQENTRTRDGGEEPSHTGGETEADVDQTEADVDQTATESEATQAENTSSPNRNEFEWLS
ncbi:hypothetical protein GJR96_07220 [Haloferax sp. MBLA0076]|uniref:CopG family transcriptional regulator n=1 Tax=Haloferax litoreum TaxID=2666140 RepID=A0A6A8GF47_9EURY|nr:MULTISPECIES: hypothetical protein [Haloferax]KAB1193246.1 hypothetical protein Hfx1148_07215 [Haloferax sp. CBA1148]MRX21745.1 hypothetical protein [Haloferax litoreum]